MNQAYVQQIEIIEHVQALHQHIEKPILYWHEPGAGLSLRHLLNLPRLSLVESLGEANIVVGTSAQLVMGPELPKYLICCDNAPLSSKMLLDIQGRGYRRQSSRLFERILDPLPNTDQIRILVLTNLYPPQDLGGYGRSIHDFTANLRLLGHKLYVLTSDAPYLGGDLSREQDVSRELRLMGTYEKKISIITDPQEQKKIMAYNDAILKRLIDEFRPNAALLGNLDMLGPSMLGILRDSNVHCWHHYGFSDPSMMPFPVNYLPTSKQGYHPVANSRYTAHSLGRVMTKHTPMPVIYPGAQTHLYSDLALRPLGGTLRIAFASLLIGAKGPHVLLEALAILHRKRISFYCELAGGWIDPHFREQLIDFASRVGIASQVDFLGKLERHQLRDLFARNQIFVFPSTWQEPFGISQVEALAAGLLVVSSGTGGAGETVHDDINGRRFRPSDSHHLAEVLEEVYAFPAGHEHLRIRGRRLAQSHFDTARESQKLSELIIRGSRSPHQ